MPIPQKALPGAVLFFFGAPLPRAFSLESVSACSGKSFKGACAQFEMFQSVVLLLIQDFRIGVSFLQVFEGHNLARVVCSKHWSLQALAQDLVAEAETVWVVGRREDAALRLGRVRVGGQRSQDLVTFIRSSTRDRETDMVTGICTWDRSSIGGVEEISSCSKLGIGAAHVTIEFH